MEENQKPLIYGKIASALADVQAVGKDHRNAQQGYNFRSIDSFYDAMQPVLAKHRIFVAPTILEHKREERQTKNGGVMMTTITKVRFRIYAEDGSFIEADQIGEGADSGDKSANKAAAMAMKYLFMQVFSVRVNGENFDSENDSPAYTPKPEQKPAKPADVLPPKPTEKTRQWALDALSAYPREIIDGWLKMMKWLDESGQWKLDHVPTSKAALKEIESEIAAYAANQNHGSENQNNCSDSGLPPEIADAVITIPRKGMKRDEYMKNPDTIGSLYAASKSGDESAGHRLFGMANNFVPEGWNGHPPRQDDIDCRKALDAFMDWREARGEK